MTKQNSNTSDFFAKYKHPLWQKRRLEVMQAANFKCQECGDAESELNVHHKYYVKGRDVWDYSDSELSCLCRKCHEYTHADSSALDDAIRAYKRDGNSLSYLAGLIDAHNGNANGWTKNIPANVEVAYYLEGFTFGMLSPCADSESRIIDAMEIVKADQRIDYFVFSAYFGSLQNAAKLVIQNSDINRYASHISEKIKSASEKTFKSCLYGLVEKLQQEHEQ